MQGGFGSRRVVGELPQFPGLGGCDLLGLGLRVSGLHFAVCMDSCCMLERLCALAWRGWRQWRLAAFSFFP